MTEAASSPETLLNSYQSARRYSPEDGHLRIRSRENLKSQLSYFFACRRDIQNFVHSETYCPGKVTNEQIYFLFKKFIALRFSISRIRVIHQLRQLKMYLIQLIRRLVTSRGCRLRCTESIWSTWRSKTLVCRRPAGWGGHTRCPSSQHHRGSTDRLRAGTQEGRRNHPVTSTQLPLPWDEGDPRPEDITAVRNECRHADGLCTQKADRTQQIGFSKVTNLRNKAIH
jgi:hypothetical protein